MNIFAVQIATRFEDEFLVRYHKARENLAYTEKELGRLFFPKRKLFVKRRGKTREMIVPVFPGYVFIDTDEISKELYWVLRRVKYFNRFLVNNKNITPLPEADIALIRHFISFGEYADKSIVTFDTDNRIIVLEGPLKGLEGRIVRIDRRKKRAKVMLDFYNNTYMIDFSFEALEKTSETEGSGTARAGMK